MRSEEEKNLYKIDTAFNNLLIDQTISFNKDVLIRQVIKLSEDGVRKALIDLGWSPPGPSDKTGWQSIDTAPKDGTHILLPFGGSCIVGYWWHSPGGEENRWCADLSANRDEDLSPTHWMPLPPKPQENNNE